MRRWDEKISVKEAPTEKPYKAVDKATPISERHFRRAVFRYRRQYAEYVEGQIEKTGDYNKLWRIDKNVVPPFGYRELSFSQAISAHLPHFMALVLYSVLFFSGRNWRLFVLHFSRGGFSPMNRRSYEASISCFFS
jgi:hypothetical protein